jgi:hypothetical protein
MKNTKIQIPYCQFITETKNNFDRKGMVLDLLLSTVVLTAAQYQEINNI